MTDTQAPEVGAPAANAIRIRAFRLLWLNNVSYFLVMNAQRFVFGWFVLDGLGGDERDQALAVFMLGIPSLLLVLPAGVWADRMDRKRLLMGSQIGTAVLMALTAMLIGMDALTFAGVLVVAALAGSVIAIGGPVRQALVPALVPGPQLISAIALTAIAMTASLIFGPVLVQLVGDQLGFSAAFWFLTGLLGVGLIFLAQLNVPQHAGRAAETVKRSLRHETSEALGFVRSHPSLKKLFLLLTVSGLTVNPAVMVTSQAPSSQRRERRPPRPSQVPP